MASRTATSGSSRSTPACRWSTRSPKCITGLDLVREQLLVAQGEELLAFEPGATSSSSGHAIEARGSTPRIRRTTSYRLPGTIVCSGSHRGSTEARFDSGDREMAVRVGIEFDPMLAKVIVHAPTRREAAVASGARALETTRIQGLTTNRDFLVSSTACAMTSILAGDTTTDFHRARRARPPQASVECGRSPRRKPPSFGRHGRSGTIDAQQARAAARAFPAAGATPVMPPE